MNTERTAIDIFAGIGGFSLAASVNGVRTIAQVEINESCNLFLRNAWPEAKQYGDIKEFDARKYRGVWAVFGGPPCQPASRAGQQRGADDDRWLWPQAIRVVEECQPTWALFENPPGILDVGLDGILSELGRLGYESQPLSIPACAVNSPQDRERIWILAHRTESGPQRGDAELPRREAGCVTECFEGFMGDTKSLDGGLLLQPGRQVQASAESVGATQGGAVANGESIRHKAKPSKGHARIEHPGGATETVLANGSSPRQTYADDTSNPGETQEQFRSRVLESQRSLESVLRGWSDSHWILCDKGKVRRFPNRLHSLGDGLSSRILEALGNAIVWPVAAQIIKAMIESES